MVLYNPLRATTSPERFKRSKLRMKKQMTAMQTQNIGVIVLNRYSATDSRTDTSSAGMAIGKTANVTFFNITMHVNQ